MAEVNLKNVKGERSNQESKEDWSHSSKKEQRVIKRDSSPKKGKSHKKRKTRKRRRTSSSSQSRSQWRNWGCLLGGITPPSRKRLPFLKEYNFFLYIEFYYVSILLKMSIGVLKLNYNASVKS